jgi:hypothetical protein
MGNYNPNYFEKKSGSLEEAILNAVNGVKTQINEKVEYVEYKFKNKNDAMKAKNMLDGIQLMGFDINDDNISNGEISVDAGKKDMTKYHNEVMKKFKPKVMTQESVTKEGSKEEYKKFFDGAMKKFGIDSPADLKSDEEKKKFFDYVDKNYKGEKDEAYHAKIKEWSGMNEAEDFKTHMMYDPKTGKGYEAKSMDDHLRMKKMGYTHEKPKMEAYEMGTKEYADHTKKITPGQTTEDWNKQVDMMQEKNNSMRSILADMWGVNEGKNPFEKDEGKQSNPDNFEPFKKKGKKEDKTMTGKPATKVSVDPDMNEKKK